jgi:hypothetical protein
VDDQGICECAGPPNNAFYGNYTGEDCLGAPQLKSLEDEENARYTTYYIAFAVLVTITFFGCFGLAWCGGTFCGGSSRYGIKEVGWRTKLTLVPFVIAFRVSDFMSDWAFYAITLRNGGFFFVLTMEQGVNYAAIHSAALAFCILGSILFVVEIPMGFFGRLHLWSTEAEVNNKYSSESSTDGDRTYATTGETCGYFWVPATTILALCLEDAPQLYLQTLYFKTVGFENADGVATFAFVMSALSLFLNLSTVLFECKRLRGAPESWSTYACRF